MADWRIQTLHDGRCVEFVDAQQVAAVGDQLVIDVTVLIDGEHVGVQRVSITDPRAAGGDTPKGDGHD